MLVFVFVHSGLQTCIGILKLKTLVQASSLSAMLILYGQILIFNFINIMILMILTMRIIIMILMILMIHKIIMILRILMIDMIPMILTILIILISLIILMINDPHHHDHLKVVFHPMLCKGGWDAHHHHHRESWHEQWSQWSPQRCWSPHAVWMRAGSSS